MVPPISQDQILKRERGQGDIYFSCLAVYASDWQPSEETRMPDKSINNTMGTTNEKNKQIETGTKYQ